MTRSRWFAIAVATLVLSISLWFGFLALSIERFTAFAIIGVGLAFSMYALAGFSGAEDIATAGFRSALWALGTAIALVIGFQLTGADALAVSAPIAGAGVGAANALEPAGDRSRWIVRIGAVGLLCVAMVWVYNVDHTVYGLVAPLLVFPVIGAVDRYYERVIQVVGESAPD